jgi:hypothetical protein
MTKLYSQMGSESASMDATLNALIALAIHKYKTQNKYSTCSSKFLATRFSSEP